jgi:hypothetical protein
MEPEPEPAAAAETGPGRLDDGAPESFTFHHLPDVAGVAATDEGVKELFAKWGFGGAQGMLQRHTFRYDQYYKAYMSDQLIKDFLNSEAVQGVFQVPVKGKEPAPLGTVSSFRCREVPCTVTSLSLFDRLGECGAVRDTGSIQKCFDNYIDDLQIGDKLLELLVDEESENFTVYDDSEREEFLFRIFRHLCIGGGMCQFEDTVGPYLDTTKKLYKDFLAVRKNDETGKAEVVSEAFELRAVKGGGPALFPSRSPYSFCYLVLNPVKRHVVLWYLPWRTMFG